MAVEGPMKTEHCYVPGFGLFHLDFIRNLEELPNMWSPHFYDNNPLYWPYVKSLPIQPISFMESIKSKPINNVDINFKGRFLLFMYRKLHDG